MHGCCVVRDARDFGAFTRLEHVGEAQAKHDGETGDCKEVDQRLCAHTTERFVITAPSNAEDHAAENNRHDDHFHHLDEDITERFKDFGTDPNLIFRVGIEIPTHEHAKQQPGNDLPN